MSRLLIQTLMTALLLLAGWFAAGPVESQAQPLNSTPPAAPVRLVFIHHSVGENLLNNGLFDLLNANNYYVTDTYYGWPGGYDIGSYTDTGQWYDWFLGPNRDTYLPDLFNNTYIHEPQTNTMPQPPGPNTVVLFKSCYPNSGGISGNPDDPPRVSSAFDRNPIWGMDAYVADAVTVANVKGLYRDLLGYFATRQDKLFILLTSPPVTPGDQFVEGSSDRARAINNWLVRHWLDNYPHNNVAVFDFFNVLTSNGGDVDTNDLGWTAGNHHRLRSGQVQHIIQTANNLAAYPSGDSHPTEAGNLKAMNEFVPLLNVAYHAWQGDGGRPFFMGRSPKPMSGPDLLLLGMSVSSAAFPNGGVFPDQYTLRDVVGQNISIPLDWRGASPQTQSFALAMVDKHPMADNFVHWLVVNLPNTVTSLAEGASAAMPPGAVQLNNTFDWPHYGGPYPPVGSGWHPYETTIYALNVPNLALPQATSLTEFQAAIAGHVLESATITGFYRID
jgi:Raf kinase inhibitor-like YbhB/YbcL family protein